MRKLGEVIVLCNEQAAPVSRIKFGIYPKQSIMGNMDFFVLVLDLMASNFVHFAPKGMIIFVSVEAKQNKKVCFA